MRVELAQKAGFCFGVKRAMTAVRVQAAKTGKKVFTYGPMIHNAQVVKRLEAAGVQVIHRPEELAGRPDAVVIIRSHGITRREK